MLRQRVKASESDRFITARSVERDKRIEKFNIKDEKQVDETILKTGLNLRESPSVEKKTRTPTIIIDEKQHSRQLYLSLLKSQIFNSGGSKCSSKVENTSAKCMSKKKKKFSEYISKISGGVEEKSEIINSTVKSLSTSQNVDEIVKKIDFSNYNLSSTENYYPNLRTVNKLNVENMPFTQGNNKSSFKKLINFELEDSEYTDNYLQHKNIPKSPYKVLDAPALKDDFYLHLIDWSCKDLLAVG